jgi:hypothetical protein
MAFVRGPSLLQKEAKSNRQSEYRRVLRDAIEEHGERPTLSTSKPERVGPPPAEKDRVKIVQAG